MRSGGREQPSARRRALLGAVAASVSVSGCVREVRNAVSREEADQLSLTILTVDADGDAQSVQLAREIRAAFERAGMDVSIELVSGVEFRRSVLINHDFDVCVGLHPWDRDPSLLYESVHSRYAEEAGWQNPFGFANRTVDDRLETMRQTGGDERAAAVADALEAIVAEQPFVPLCRPAEYRLVRTAEFDGWGDGHPAERRGYLELEPTDGETALVTAHVDARPTQNLNPLAVEYRQRGTIINLLYDSLGLQDGADVSPWLAESWSWEDGTLAISLRPDCTFHDGESLTAADVAFTYRFLENTTLGNQEFPAPTTRLRGAVAAVESVEVTDSTELVLEIDGSEAVAHRSLLVPILPEHVWEPRSEPATVGGIEVAEGTTDALVADNVDAVGSGPYQIADVAERRSLTLERFDEHFTRRGEGDRPEPSVETVRFQIDPGSASAIERIQAGDADLTSLPVETDAVEAAREATTADDLTMLESPGWSFYHLGFNTRRAPFQNPNFRRVAAQLLDKAWLVETVFDGYADPIAAPTTAEWTPTELTWDGADPVAPFLGHDGEIDATAVRDAFREIGFRYADDGTLRVSQ